VQWTVVRGKKDLIVADTIQAARERLSQGSPGDRPRRKSRDWGRTCGFQSCNGCVDLSPFGDTRPNRRSIRARHPYNCQSAYGKRKRSTTTSRVETCACSA